MKISKITESIKLFKKFFQNKKFGGGPIINQKNSLNENILAVKSNHGGYHFYEKVPIKKGQFSDFFILKINSSAPRFKADTFIKLKQYLTGFVREVRYKDNGCILSIQEGFMEKGYLSGFGRIVTVSP